MRSIHSIGQAVLSFCAKSDKDLVRDRRKGALQRAAQSVCEALEARQLFTITLYHIDAPSHLSQGDAGVDNTGVAVSQSHEWVIADSVSAAISLAGVSVSGEYQITQAGSVSLPSVAGVPSDTYIVAYDDNAPGYPDDDDFNDGYAAINVESWLCYIGLCDLQSLLNGSPSSGSGTGTPNAPGGGGGNSTNLPIPHPGTGQLSSSQSSGGSQSTGGSQYGTGDVAITSNSLISSGLGAPLGVRSTWTNNKLQDPSSKASGERGSMGDGRASAQPRLSVINAASAGGTTKVLQVVLDGANSYYFILDGGTYGAQLGALSSATESGSGASQRYIWKSTTGESTTFYGEDSAINAGLRGQIESYTDAGGRVTTYTYDGSYRLSEQTRSETVGGDTITESWLYAYVGGAGPNKDFVSSVTLRRKVNAGSYSTVRSLEYTYYDGTQAYGNIGDLMYSVLKDGSGSEIDTSYYRYYVPQALTSLTTTGGGFATATATLTGHGFQVGDVVTIDGADQTMCNGSFTITAVPTADTFQFVIPGSPPTTPTGTITAVARGYAGGLKYVFENAAYDRMAATVSNPLTATDATIAQYASQYIEYDALGRVSKSVVGADGCSTCSGGLGTYTYTYETSTNGDDYNSWHTKTTETLPDGNQNIVYTNRYGQVMLKTFVDRKGTPGTPGDDQQWSDFFAYDSAGRMILHALPSAVTGYDDLDADLMGNVSGDYDYVADSAGLVYTYTYPSSTTATSSVAGDAIGYLKSTAIKNGDTGTAIPQQAYTYLSRTGNGTTIFVTASSTVYEDTAGATARTTSYSYTWQGSTTRMESMTTTLPIVTTAKNGSNSATSNVVVYDADGRPIWTKDEDGYINYTEYDVATGAVIKTVTDVDTTQVSNEPSGWTTPGSGGKHLITQTVVDSLGRTTKLTDPNGNVTYTIYNDANHEVRVYRGWTGSGSSGSTTGPIEITREYRPAANASSGRRTVYFETILSSATPTASSGVPTGAETIDASNIQSLSRKLTNEAGQVNRTDAYSSLSSITYSSATETLGALGTNYLRTESDYDSRGRLKRVKDASGTIHWTVYDGLNRVVSTWIGTNDAGAINGDPDGTGSPNNMLKIAEYEYDDPADSVSGGGVGDGNLTKSLQWFGGGGSDCYTTRYQYDFRNRITGQRGPSSVATAYTYDNLNRPTASQLFADADTDFVIDSTELRGKSEAEYDERGKVFRSAKYEVDPSTGTASDSLATLMWYDARGNLIKTSTANGLFTKSTFDGVGRFVATYTSYDSTEFSSPTYAAADDVSGDRVIEQKKIIYDKSGRAVVQTSYKTKSGSPSTGELASNNSFIQASVLRYDRADRLTDTILFGRDNGTRKYVFRSDGAIADGLDLNGDNDYVDASEVAGDGDGIPYYADVDRDGDADQYEVGDATLDPNTSDDYIVARTEYDAGGRAYRSIDNKGHIAETTFDLLGRKIKLVENYVNGTATETETDTDRTTTWTYDSRGRLSQMTAKNPKGSGNGVEDQVTQYIYTSEIDRSWQTLTAYPDTSSGPGSAKSVSSLTQTGGLATVTSTAHGFTAGDMVLIEGATPGSYNGWFTVLSATTNTFTYNVGDSSLASATGTITAKKWTGTDQTSTTFDRLGRKITSTDQRGVVHTYTFDSAGRLAADSATTIPGGVDGAVKRIGYTYDDLSRQQKITSYPNADGTGTIVNEVRYTYDGWGNVSKSEQSHAGAVVPGTTPAISYTYEDGAASGVAKYVRLATVTYPDGRPIAYIYPNSGDSYVLSRADIVDDQSTDTMAEYTWVGTDLVVAINHPDVTGGLVLDYGTASDYDGFDRFGRIISQKWRNTSGSTNFDLFTYTYDRDSNRLTKDVGSVNGTMGHDEAYTYDGLDRLASFQRGTITSGSIGSVNYSQNWNTLDSLGNWQQFTEDTNGSTSGGSTTYNRTSNKANETTDSGSTWIDPVYDAAGNMITAPKTGSETTALYYFYDAWGRLVGVSLNNDSDFTDTNEWRYSYDGLNRRIFKDRAGNTSADDEFFLSEKDQVLQMLRGGNASAYQTNVWDVRYVDDPIAVYRDWNFDGTPNDKHWLITDANYNVTALIGRDGIVKERYEYNPYGERIVLDDDFSLDADNVSNWANDYGHQGLRHDAETGLVYNRARYLHPSLGLFAQREPFGGSYIDGGNLFQYEASSPLGMLDPSGLKCKCQLYVLQDPEAQYGLTCNIYTKGWTMLTYAGGFCEKECNFGKCQGIFVWKCELVLGQDEDGTQVIFFQWNKVTQTVGGCIEPQACGNSGNPILA